LAVLKALRLPFVAGCSVLTKSSSWSGSAAALPVIFGEFPLRPKAVFPRLRGEPKAGGLYLTRARAPRALFFLYSLFSFLGGWEPAWLLGLKGVMGRKMTSIGEKNDVYRGEK